MRLCENRDLEKDDAIESEQRIASFRCLAFLARKRLHEQGLSQEGTEALLEHVFDSVARSEELLIPDLLVSRNKSPFHTELKHRHLIFQTVLSLYVVSPATTVITWEDRDLLVHTEERFEKFCRDVLARTHPEEAAALLDDLASIRKVFPF
jgi:hypothetical protein